MNNESPTIEENPYQSPVDDELDCKYPSAMKAFVAGARSGFLFGGVWIGLILGSLALLFGLGICAAVAYQLYHGNREYLQHLDGLLVPYGKMVVVSALTTCCTAASSALIMGFAELRFYWRAKKKIEKGI